MSDIARVIKLIADSDVFPVVVFVVAFSIAFFFGRRSNREEEE